MIYLLTSDGYIDSLIPDYYATTEEELVANLAAAKAAYFEHIRNAHVDFDAKVINFQTNLCVGGADDWEDESCEFIAIPRAKMFKANGCLNPKIPGGEDHGDRVFKMEQQTTYCYGPEKDTKK